jgi:hypothetical protein
MVKHIIDSAIFDSLARRWIRLDAASGAIVILGCTNEVSAGEAYAYTRNPIGLPLISDRLLDPSGSFRAAESSGPDTRYLCYGVAHGNDEGEFSFVEGLASRLQSALDVIDHPALLSELTEKLERARRYLSTPPNDWIRRLVPIDDRVIDTILSDDRLFHARWVTGRSSLTFAGTTYVPLGVWARLWKRGDAVTPCSACGGRVYYFDAAASLSSGRGSGICGTCGSYASEPDRRTALDAARLTRGLDGPFVRPFRMDSAVAEINRLLGRASE